MFEGMKKGVFAVCFIALMVLMGGASIASYLKTHFIERTVEETGQEPVHSLEVNPSHLSNGLLEAINYVKIGIDSYSRIETPVSSPFIHFAGWYNETVQGDILLGEGVLLRLSNGYYTLPYPYSRSEESWNGLLDFIGFLKSKDIKAFHLILPDKGDDSFGTFPKDAPQGYSRMAEEYMAFLDRNGIDYMEAKPKMLAQNGDFYHWFYKTDHRINIQSGLLLAEESAKKLKSLGVEADTDIVKKDNFSRVVYPNSFLGSFGHALGYNHKEDFEIYYPEGETCFRIRYTGGGYNNYGSFEKTLVREKFISPISTSLNVFLSASPVLSIENCNSNNETRVMIIGLCKIDVICPYLALAVRHLDMVDPRNYNGKIRSFIEQTNPDAVILCIDVPWVGGEECWKLQ